MTPEQLENSQRISNAFQAAAQDQPIGDVMNAVIRIMATAMVAAVGPGARQETLEECKVKVFATVSTIADLIFEKAAAAAVDPAQTGDKVN